MLLNPISLIQPTTLEEAVAALAEYGASAAALAGGTELLLLMKMGLSDFSHLVNLKRIPGLGATEMDDANLRIGALTSHARIADNPLVQEHALALARLCGSIANARVRNSGTLGGNLCFAEPRADPPVLLAAMGAQVELVGAGSRRRMLVEEFIVEPLTTALEPAEIMTEISVPLDGARIGCERVASGSHSLATAAVAIGPATRVWVGHGGGMARLDGASELLANMGEATDEAAFARKVAEDIDQVEVASDLEASADYRRHLVVVAAVRAMRQALSNTGGPVNG